MDLYRLTLLIIKATEDDADDINHLPDDETAAGHELEDTGDDLAGVDAVNATEATADEQAEQEAGETGTGGLVGAVMAAAHSGICFVD